MRKFKHKKTGDIAVKHTINYKIETKQYDTNIPAEIIENSYDWEEIIEKPLFVTKDGVELFKGDNYFQITHKFHYAKCTAYDESNFSDELIIFSNEYAAQGYIDLHKPKYSLKDVAVAYGGLMTETKKMFIQNLKNLNK